MTAADRAKAAEVLFRALDARETNTASWEAIADAQVDRVAAALAAARADADARWKAAVEGLAEEFESWRENAERFADARAGSIGCDRAQGRVRAYARAAARLRGLVTGNSEEE